MRRSAGFTLIEVLVALAIAGLGLAALVAVTGTGLGNVDLATKYIEATRRAQSRLAMVAVSQPLVAGEQSGDDGGGYSWTTRISAPVVRAVVAGADPAPALFDVEVEISWRNGSQKRSVSIRSERLGAAVPSPNG